jgi:hypothetical protein
MIIKVLSLIESILKKFNILKKRHYIQSQYIKQKSIYYTKVNILYKSQYIIQKSIYYTKVSMKPLILDNLCKSLVLFFI